MFSPLSRNKSLTCLQQTDEHGHFSLETLQSQLFILKVLSVNLASRLSAHISLGSPTNAPSVFEHSQTDPPPEATSPPLEERCVRYVLSIVLGFLRNSAPSEPPLVLPSKTSDITFREFEVEDVGEPATGGIGQVPNTDMAFLPSSVASVAGSASALVVGYPSGRQQNRLLPLRNQPSIGSVLSSTSTKTRSSSTFSPYTNPSRAHGHRPVDFPCTQNANLVPPSQTKYERTHSSLIKSRTACISFIAEFSGRIIFFISLTNWYTVYERWRAKIRVLANKPEETMREDLTDLMLLGWIVLDRAKLVQVLNGASLLAFCIFLLIFFVEVSSLLVNMAREAQVAIAIPLRSAIWNWITYYPSEFNELVTSTSAATIISNPATTNVSASSSTTFVTVTSTSRSGGTKLTEGAPERVFDLLYSKMKSSSNASNAAAGGLGMSIGVGVSVGGSGSDERVVWPALAALCCMTSEKLAMDYVSYTGKRYKSSRKACVFLSSRAMTMNIHDHRRT